MERGGGGWPGRIIKAAWKQYKTIKGSYHNRAVQPGTILYLAGKRGGDGGTAAAHASRRIGERWREEGGGGQLSNICDNNLEPGIEALVAASCKSRICIYGLFDPFLLFIAIHPHEFCTNSPLPSRISLDFLESG